MLHKADRHLIYPEGGIEELKRQDPMLIAEEREQQRRMRQNQRRNPHPLPNKPSQKPAKQSQDGDDSSDSDGSEGNSDSDSDPSEDDDEYCATDAGDNAAGSRKAEEAKASTKMLDGPTDATISGLNIQLNSPELIAEWINQRKKRWPTQDVVKQKLKEKEERQRRSEMIYGPRPQPYGKRPREEVTTATGPQENTGASDARIDEGAAAKKQRADSDTLETDAKELVPAAAPAEDERSDSDDGAPEELSSKAPVPLEEETRSPSLPIPSSTATQDAKQDRRPICTHFLQGRCNYGDRCKKRHDTTPAASASGSSGQQQQQRQQSNGTARRPHPRPPPVNPFDQPDLLRQLLRNEIEKHVDAVGQAIRFIVDNDMLLHVETEEGQAEEQRKRRQKIQVLPANADGMDTAADEPNGAEKQEASTSSELQDEPRLSEPLVQGGMAVVNSSSPSTASDAKRASLYRPPSPTLRPLSELRYPPEPDPLIYLDPLRRDDPKPLMPSQLICIAKDPVLRSVLTPSTPLHPNGHKPASLERAIVSLDALPSDLYRNAAIEMILGIASSSTSGSNPAGGLVVTSKDGRRKVSETDLFRMGLRVGGDEVLAIKKLADRLSVLLDSSLQLDEVGEVDWALLSREQRDEMRKLHYEREADRLDRLRKLGIDV